MHPCLPYKATHARQKSLLNYTFIKNAVNISSSFQLRCSLSKTDFLAFDGKALFLEMQQ